MTGTFGRLMSRDEALAEYARLGIRPIGGGSQDNPTDPPDNQNDDPQDPPADSKKLKIEFTPEQMAEVQRIARKEAKDARDKALADAKAERDRADEAARVAKERDEATKRGEFDQVRTSLESERDAAKTEAESTKARAEAAEAIITAEVERRWKDLHADSVALYTDLGNPDDVMAKYKALPRLETHTAQLKGTASPGAGVNPRIAGAAKPEIHSLVTSI